MSILEHDITVTTPDGMRVDLHRRPLSIEVEGQSIPTSFLDTVAIAWTFRSLVRSRRRAERAVFSEIVNAL
jgi:predicted acetyltransferase